MLLEGPEMAKAALPGGSHTRNRTTMSDTIAPKTARSSPLAIAPATFSHRTCEPITGTRWRALRPWLQERGVPIAKIGRRAIVRVADYLAALGGPEAPAPVAEWKPADVIAMAAKRGTR